MLASLRPAVVALIASAGMSILMLALFNADISSFKIGDFRLIECGLFIAGIYALRKYKMNAITVILGSGVVGTLLYLITGFAI